MDQTGLELDSVLKEILRRLVTEFKPESIFLFGSRARGSGGPDSDYDLMVVVSTSSDPRYKRMQKAQQLLWGIWAAADILVLTHDEFERSSGVVSSLPAAVIREGLKLYAS